MDADQHVVGAVHLPLDERHVMLVVDQRAVADRDKFPERGRQAGRDDALDELLVPAPVGDQVRDRDHLQPVAVAVRAEVRNPRHRPVVVHDLADHAGRVQAGEPREVDRRLGLADPLEHAAGLGLEREHVPWLDELAGARLGIDRDLDRARAIRGRDPGADA